MKKKLSKSLITLCTIFSFLNSYCLFGYSNADYFKLVPEIIGQCEYPEVKSYNKDMIVYKKDFKDIGNWQDLLTKGNVYLSYTTFDTNELRKKFSTIRVIRNDEVFAQGLLTVSHGLYMTEMKNDSYFTPRVQLSKDMVEGTGRKMTHVGFLGPFEVELSKFVKTSLPFISNMHIKFFATSSIYHKKEDRWEGEAKFFLSKNELNFFVAPLLSAHKNLQHMHSMIMYSKGKDKMLRGTYFITNVFLEEHSGKILMETWQVVSININWILNLAMKLLPNLLKKTLFRDYSRHVDFTRTFGNLDQ